MTSKIKELIKLLIKKSGFFKGFFKLQSIKIPVTFFQYIKFHLFGDRRFYWPIHKNSVVTGNVYVGMNSSVGATPGCYIQGIGEIYIGNYCMIAPNVGIISANHDVIDYRRHIKKSVIIKDYCWIGMNAVILPGVVLGKHTVVAAGSVVKDSFPDGFCILAGNPAKVIKRIEIDLTENYVENEEMYGYIHKDKFGEYSRKYKIKRYEDLRE